MTSVFACQRMIDDSLYSSDIMNKDYTLYSGKKHNFLPLLFTYRTTRIISLYTIDFLKRQLVFKHFNNLISKFDCVTDFNILNVFAS